MTDEEYREFMAVLVRRHVQPRLPRLRRRFHHHMMEEWHYHLDQAERSMRIFRFIEENCDDGDDIYDTISPIRVGRAVSETRYSLDFSNRTLEESGFLDAFEPHMRDILDGLRPDHLPLVDQEVIRNTGSPDAEAELAELVHRARAYRSRAERMAQEVSSRQQLRHVAEQVARIQKEFEEFSSSQTDQPREPPKKPRPWFKGLGQIGQGAALSIANVALAVGVIQFPVSPETRTWGALASVATGIGTVLSGVGALRNE